MAPKKGNKSPRETTVQNKNRPAAFQPAAETICFYHAPAPKYNLKPVVGYEDHCPTKYRSPAYSIAGKRRAEIEFLHPSPGPIYSPTFPRPPGFSMGLPIKRIETRDETPGPYSLPEAPHGPAFSMSFRIPEKIAGSSSPGPYYLPDGPSGPAFTIGTRIQRIEELHVTPPPRLTSVGYTLPRAPAFSLQFKRRHNEEISNTPGPYDPVELDKGPAFTFGVKHHPCTFPYITPCDKLSWT